MSDYTYPDDIEAALLAAERLRQREATWPETRQAFEDIAARPDASPAMRADIASRLLIAATTWYHLPDDDIASLLAALRTDLDFFPQAVRAEVVIAACLNRPALGRIWLPGIVSALKALDQSDPDIAYWLEAANAELARVQP